MTTARPRLALTMGDVAGIGPEIIARALVEGDLHAICRPIVVGHPELLRRALEQIGRPGAIVPVDPPFDALPDHVISCWNPAGDEVCSVMPGVVQPAAGRAAYDYVVAAARSALRGDVEAITTAPLHKEALNLAGVPYPGHTEILAAECGVREVAMMLYLPPGFAVRGPRGLGVAHVTLHTSLRSVPDLLTTPRVVDTIRLLHGFLQRLEPPSEAPAPPQSLRKPPHIGVCALNPHAGEHGLFGDEEDRLIAPAVAAARNLGLQAVGPVPADALLRRAVAGEFDGVAAMYHDQGHIALKLIGWDLAVNVTLGLPIVRTSPSHGTAFDIAGQGRARAEGFLNAARVACQLARTRSEPLT
jgi:4-hydroxythreonine-4-phosphate dehydrogenase